MNILLTGGASGLGEAITRDLAKDTACFVNFTYCKSSVNALKIESEFKNTKGHYCDFSDENSVTGFAEKLFEMDIDVLINNAVTGLVRKHFHKTLPKEYAVSFHDNVYPVIVITSAALALFRKKKAGRIINILSSFIFDVPPIGLSEYIANKNYLLSLSNSIATENSKLGIISNCISPDVMAGGLNKSTDERVLQDLANNNPAGRLLTLNETASAVKYLLTASENINGKNIEIRAGMNLSFSSGL